MYLLYIVQVFIRVTGLIVSTTSTTENSPIHRHSPLAALVIVIGVVGLLTNARELHATLTTRHSTKHSTNALLVNQMSLDLFSCVWVVITYSLKFTGVPLTGVFGYWVCLLVGSESVLWVGLYGSALNLASIAVERYAKIVHPTWHKNSLRPWMMYTAIAFTWISATGSSLPVAAMTAVVRNGECIWGAEWLSDTEEPIYITYAFVMSYGAIAVAFLFCCWRVVAVVRQQYRAVAIQQSTSTTLDIQLIRSHVNTARTLVMASVSFTVFWTPCNVYLLISCDLLNTAYFSMVLVGFVNVCLNPLIFAAKFDDAPTRRHLPEHENAVGQLFVVSAASDAPCPILVQAAFDNSVLH